MPRCIFAAVMMVCLLVSGCATKVPHVGESRYYAHCVTPLVEMQQKDAEVAKSTAKSALVGALAGAIIGFIATGDITGALIGLGVGALSGGAIGYTFTKIEQISDENTRFASIRATANQDLTKANRTQLYAYESITCYMREFDNLQNSYVSGTVTKEEFASRFREIRKAMVVLGEVIGNMDKEITRTEHEFNASLAKGGADVHAPTRASSTPVAKRKPVRRERTQRAGPRLSDTLAQNKRRVEETQMKVDDDLTTMLEDCAGRVTPPPQNVQAIKQQYGEGYATTLRQVEDLRAVHREALDIMDAAAVEAGIDMV